MTPERELPAAVFFDAYRTLIFWQTEPSPFDVVETGLHRASMNVSRASVETALRAEMAYYKQHFSKVQTREQLDRLRRDDARVFREALGDAAADAPPVDDLVVLLGQAFETHLLPDALPAIQRLRAAGVRTGVLSNFSFQLPLILEDVGLGGLLDPIIVSAEAGVEKPDVAIFTAAARAVNATVDRCVMIGDDLVADIAGARSAGMPSIWVNRRHEPVPVGVTSSADLADAVSIVLTGSWRTPAHRDDDAPTGAVP